MNWINTLTTVEGAQQELSAFEIALRGPIFSLLVQRLVVETPIILLTRESLKASCGMVSEDSNSFHRALERHRVGSPEYLKGTRAYITNSELKSEATRARTGAYPMSCYFVFVLVPRIVKRRGTYDRQEFFANFPRDLVSEDTLEKVWAIWEGHARAGRFGLTWDADALRDQQHMPAFDALFTSEPHTPTHFEIVRDDMYMNGESSRYGIAARTGLSPQEVLEVCREYSFRSKDKSKRFFIFSSFGEIKFSPLGMYAAAYDQACRLTNCYDFSLKELAAVLRTEADSTILGGAVRALVKAGWLTVDKSLRPYRYSLAR